MPTPDVADRFYLALCAYTDVATVPQHNSAAPLIARRQDPASASPPTDRKRT